MKKAGLGLAVVGAVVGAAAFWSWRKEKGKDEVTSQVEEKSKAITASN